MNGVLILVLFASVLSLAYAVFNFFDVKKMDEDTEQMSEIASPIRVGANAFIHYEYRILFSVAPSHLFFPVS